MGGIRADAGASEVYPLPLGICQRRGLRMELSGMGSYNEQDYCPLIYPSEFLSHFVFVWGGVVILSFG